jgi:DNA repair protein RadC
MVISSWVSPFTFEMPTVVGIFEVSNGGISGASADVRIVFAAALKASATGIILAHNHPSGQLTPSDAEV